MQYREHLALIHLTIFLLMVIFGNLEQYLQTFSIHIRIKVQMFFYTSSIFQLGNLRLINSAPSEPPTNEGPGLIPIP
jgi:hypothetical protein